MNDCWLYIQLFHHTPVVADTILTTLVKSSSKTLLDGGEIDRFFFLRYFEDGHHIRYRLRATNPAQLDLLERRLRQFARACTEVVRVVKTPYEPEILKHGGAAGLEIAERQFFASSQLALSYLEAGADLERRTLVGLSAMEAILRHAGLDRDARRRCCLDYAAHWRRALESGGGRQPWTALDPGSVELARPCIDSIDVGLAGPAATRWLETVVEDMAALRDLNADGRLDVPMQVVLWNLIHTFNNRLGLDAAAESELARVVSLALALPARPTTVPVLHTDNRTQVWTALATSLSAGHGGMLAIDGDARTTLTHWRAEAQHIGVRWIESSRAAPREPRPFALWCRLAAGIASDAVEALDQHLADARRPWSDPGCPMLPDPTGVYDEIARFLLPRTNQPTILVLRDVAGASPDCLDALASIVLRGRSEATVLIFVADAGPGTLGEPRWRRWVRLLDRLRVQAGLHHVQLRSEPGQQDTDPVPQGVVAEPEAPAHMSAASHARVGPIMCRAGALTTGVHHIATAIAADARHGDDPGLLVHLAMATLQLHRRDLAAEAAEAAYRLGPNMQDHRARRVWMATLHGNHDVEGLERLRDDVLRDIERADPSSPQHAWLLLDAAMCTALNALRRSEHVQYLDTLLSRSPGAISRQCLATAYLWRAAPCFAEGHLSEALPHQLAGVRVLETLADPTRLLFARLNLGGTLWHLGHFEQAAALFERVAAVALCRGDFDTALDAASRAVLTRIEVGQDQAATALLHGAAAPLRYMWSRTPSVTLACELALAIASNDGPLIRALAEMLPKLTSMEVPPSIAQSIMELHVGHPTWSGSLTS